MGIFSTLLRGGELIGKICENLSKAVSNMYTDEETGIRFAVGSDSICGVKFYQSFSANGTEATIKAFNCNTNHIASVVFTNDPSGNGVAYDIAPMENVNVTPEMSQTHSPDKEVVIGLSGSEKANARGGSIVKLGLCDLTIGGKPICIPDYTISCTTSGIKVNSGSRGLGALRYIDMSSGRGLLLNSQNSIGAKVSNGKDYSYDIDMNNFGLQEGDTLTGHIHIELDGNGLLTPFDNSCSEPLTDAEKRCFKALGIIE